MTSLLRTAGTRTTTALHDGLAGVVDTGTPDDARGYFQQCGYGRYARP